MNLRLRLAKLQLKLKRTLPLPAILALKTVSKLLRYPINFGKSLYVILKTETILLNKKAKPRYLLLEPTNICNANCIFCSYQFDQRPKAELDNAVFERCVNEYKKNGGKSLHLTPTVGEIFIDKSIMDKLGYARSKNFKTVHTYTNGSLLHRFDVDEILNSGLTDISISTAPFEESLYRYIYRNNLYKTVLKNVEKLLTAFHQNSKKTVQSIEVSFRSDRTLEDCKALPDYQKYIAPYVKGNVVVTAMSVYDAWSDTIKQEDLLEGMTLLHSERKGRVITCPRIFDVQVTANGTIRLCGCRFDNNAIYDELAIGDIQEISIQEAYNLPETKKKIMSFTRGQMLEVCKKCSWYDPQHW